MKEKMFSVIIAVIFIVLFACGPKRSTQYDGNCYQTYGDEVKYTCKNDSPQNPGSNTGYAGPNNPKALNLFRPGRFEDANSPVW